MKNKSKLKDYNSNLINSSITNEKNLQQKERKKRIEREKRIKEINKNKRQEQDSFDFDTETVIGMTNKNNSAKVQGKKQAMSRKQKKLQKRRKKIKRILKFFTILILIIGAGIFAVTSPIFNIKKVEVVNNKQLSTDTVISLSGLTLDKNIFKFFKQRVERAIEENAYVENATVTRVLPGTVRISIEEREKKFSLEFLNGYAYINNQGYILEISEDKLDLPVIQGASTPEENIVPGNRLENGDLKKLGMVISIMDSAKENNLEGKVTSIDISNENDYSIYLEEEQKTIHLGDGSNLTNRMIRVQPILESEKGKPGDIFVNGNFNNKFKAYFREKV